MVYWIGNESGIGVRNNAFGRKRTVNRAGGLRFQGVLADGTPVVQSSIVSKNGQWPFYAALFGGQGSVLGWILWQWAPE